MQVYVALRDYSLDCESWVVGAFSTEERAETACQEDENGMTETAGLPPVKLVWTDAVAPASGGDQYAIVLVDLDVPV